MTNSGAASAAAAQPQAPDTQTLITLLANLMPLLLRLQVNPLEPSLALGQFGPFAPFGAPAPASNPTLDQQAAVTFVEDITAESLRALSSFLEAQEGRYAGLETCVPIVTRGAQAFAMRDYAQAFGLIWQTYRLIAVVRAANPQLPPVRAGATAGAMAAQAAAAR
jgi:hypothetical protein